MPGVPATPAISVAPRANSASAVASAVVVWAVWLAVPVAVTLLVAMGTWVRSRPRRQPSTARALREHAEYLDALAAAAQRNGAQPDDVQSDGAGPPRQLAPDPAHSTRPTAPGYAARVPRLSLPRAERIPGSAGFARLSRRVRTLIVTGVLFLVLFVLALVMPVPYVILTPGPTFNTLGTAYGSPVIAIDGRTPNSTTGHLNLTTVSVSSTSISAVQALIGWLAHDQIVVPRSAVYPPNQTTQQTNAQNIEDFVDAQDSATQAALCQLGYPQGASVVETVKGSGAVNKLQPNDRFVSVDGKPTVTEAQLEAVLGTATPGATVPVVVVRAGKDVTEDITLGAPDKGRSGASLGVALEIGCFAPFTVDLGLANRIGGPSAGLMFALGILDKVGKVDLTGGRFIAGTGTIDSSGNVGAIGGIALKMIAARDKGATVFLVPAGNCSDVIGAIPSGLDVVKVSTLKGAVTDLLDLQHNKPVPHC